MSNPDAELRRHRSPPPPEQHSPKRGRHARTHTRIVTPFQDAHVFVLIDCEGGDRNVAAVNSGCAVLTVLMRSISTCHARKRHFICTAAEFARFSFAGIFCRRQQVVFRGVASVFAISFR